MTKVMIYHQCQTKVRKIGFRLDLTLEPLESKIWSYLWFNLLFCFENMVINEVTHPKWKGLALMDYLIFCSYYTNYLKRNVLWYNFDQGGLQG